MQVNRSPEAWIQEGHELDETQVQSGTAFKAPTAKMVMFWKGGPEVEDCKVLATRTYEVMNGETAKNMCAALANSRGHLEDGK